MADMGRNLFALLVLAAAAASGEVSVVRGTARARDNDAAKSLSGITYAGGGLFYAVADDSGTEGGLYTCSIELGPEGTNIVSFSICSTNERVKLGTASDLEGVARDPATGHVWATDEGAVASFEVAGDDTLRWTGLSAAQPVATTVLACDTFEEYAVGATAVTGALRGWSGATGSAVMAGTPDVGAAGLPMSAAPHEHVLAIPFSAYRTYGEAPAGNQKFELMFRVAPEAGIGFYDLDGDWFASLFVTDDGSLEISHDDGRGGFTEAVLDAGPFARGDWIRLGFLLDRTTDPTFLEVSIDGTPRASEHGVRSRADPVIPADASGTWHRTRLHAVGWISEVRIYGDTAVDDVLLAEADFPTESAPGYVRADGVPSDWMRARGLDPVFGDLSAPTAIRDGDRVYTLGDAFTAGVDPDGTDPLREAAVELLPDGRVRIVLNGIRPDNAAAYAVYGAADLAALSTDDPSRLIPGAFHPDSATGRTVWTSDEPVGDAAFFRVKASR